MGFLPSFDEWKFMLIICPVVILLLILGFYPPNLWFPFAEFLPDWIADSPPYFLIMQAGPVWIAGILLGVGIVFLRRAI